MDLPQDHTFVVNYIGLTMLLNKTLYLKKVFLSFILHYKLILMFVLLISPS
jgi:hypothetical protein